MGNLSGSCRVSDDNKNPQNKAKGTTKIAKPIRRRYHRGGGGGVSRSDGYISYLSTLAMTSDIAACSYGHHGGGCGGGGHGCGCGGGGCGS